MSGRYQLVVTPTAARQIARHSPKVIDAVVAFITGPLLDNPKRIGKPLSGNLSGHWSARRGDYRVVYLIDDDVVTVTVVRVGPRRSVYRA